MLKITSLDEGNGGRRLKLEGRLLDPWVAAFQDAWAAAIRESPEVRLDLFAVSFTDNAGLEALRELISRGAQVVACSPYISDLLHLEKKS